MSPFGDPFRLRDDSSEADDILKRATLDRYEAEVRRRMTRHAAINPQEPTRRLENQSLRLALHREIDVLLDSISLLEATA